jgi:soluble P-type ATPase
MIEFTVPGKGILRFEALLLDLNGTLATDGHILAGVRDRIATLAQVLDIYLVTCDTHGNGARIADELGIRLIRAGLPGPEEAETKAQAARSLKPERIIAIGNGDADALMLKESDLAIAVLGDEGLSIKALQQADILVRNICDALDLLQYERRLIATLRGSP